MNKKAYEICSKAKVSNDFARHEVPLVQLTDIQKDIEKMEEDPDRWILFACYLYEGRTAKTTEQKYSKKNLQEFIHRHLQLVDSEEEKEGVIFEQKQCSC